MGSLHGIKMSILSLKFLHESKCNDKQMVIMRYTIIDPFLIILMMLAQKPNSLSLRVVKYVYCEYKYISIDACYTTYEYPKGV